MEGAVANMKKPLPFLPPGKEYGETWDEARKYDYAMDIYVTPEYIAYPLKGTGFLLSQLHSKYSDPVCKGGDSKVILRFVISPNGQLIGTHPIGRVSLDCLVHLTKSVMDVKYFPAEYNGENVYMLHAVTINDRR
ncbi:MAG: hypothetical protein U5K71_02450 [Gracilimonas sp.]|nr:hypothetical protein [Gracilimonas sp.]